MNEAAYSYKQLTLFDECELQPMANIPASSFGRTCPALSAVTKEWILEPCLSTSQKPKFQFLKVEDGRTPEWLNGTAVRVRGECLTLNIGECPNEENESFLSQILEDNPPEKYFLSDKACAGILRRAAKRGKDLPDELKAALMRQLSDYDKESPGGGKGALIRNEQSLSLKSENDQVLFVPDKARSLTARNDGSPCIDRGPELIATFSVDSIANYKEASQATTLRASGGDSGGGSENLVKVGALCATDYKGIKNEVVENGKCVVQKKTVRRLTPLECERLQGLPDYFTLIDDKTCSDTARYKALGNGMAAPCANYVIRRIKEATA